MQPLKKQNKTVLIYFKKILKYIRSKGSAVFAKKFVKDFIVLMIAFLISYLLYNSQKVVFELYPMAKMIILIKTFSMIALIALPFREYFQWALNEKINGWRAWYWLFMIIVAVLFLFLPLIVTQSVFLYEQSKSNPLFIGINILALAALTIAHIIIKNQLENEKKEAEKSIRNKIIFLDYEVENTQAHNQLLLEIKNLNTIIKKHPITKSFYEDIILYADICILISLIVTLIFYFLFHFCFDIPFGGIYEKFFDGATTFQLIISTVISFVISIKYEKRR